VSDRKRVPPIGPLPEAYFSFRLAGTNTRRWSSERPAIQNTPIKGTGIGRRIRQAFTTGISIHKKEEQK
jgi:DNA polymerase I-like protein with 3'-5' exonuclease and polymerase domains